MAEYIDLDTPLELYVEHGGFYKKQISTLRDLLDTNIIPYKAADVRPVVLCRECKHWETDWTPQGVSDGRHYCAPLDLFPSADWFCADGEKREES